MQGALFGWLGPKSTVGVLGAAIGIELSLTLSAASVVMVALVLLVTGVR